MPHDLVSMPVSFGDISRCHQRFRILCYGDSLTVGFFCGGLQFEPYGRSLSDALSAAGIANEVVVCGHNGVTAEDMVVHADGTLVDVVGLRGKGLRRILQDDGLHNLAIIMAGTNDMGGNASNREIVEWIRRLHEDCHERGIDTVMVVPPPTPCGGFEREKRRQELVRLLENVAKSMPHVVAVLDVGGYLPYGCKQSWDRDGLHFSSAGSQRLGNQLATMLVTKLRTADCADRARKSHSASRLRGDVSQGNVLRRIEVSARPLHDLSSQRCLMGPKTVRRTYAPFQVKCH